MKNRATLQHQSIFNTELTISLYNQVCIAGKFNPSGKYMENNY